MKPFPFLFCTLSFFTAAQAEPVEKSAASSSESLSLGAVTQAILASNPSIKEARARWEAAQQRVPQARAWDDLKISADTRLARFADVAANSFTDQMFSVEQAIPISGRNQSRGRVATADAAQAFEDLRRNELDTVAKARAAYFRLAKGYALLDLLHANETSLQQSLEAERAKFEAGGQSQATALAAENEVTKCEEMHRDLERAISAEETQLKVLMNRDVFTILGKPADLSRDRLPSSLNTERLRVLALHHRPEVLMADLAVASAAAKVELAKRDWIPDPSITLEAQRYNGASQGVSEVSAGVSFTVPWFNKAKYRAEEAEAAKTLEAARHAAESARNETVGLLRDHLSTVDTYHHHLELFDTQLIPKARQAVDATRLNFASGKANLPDLLASQRNLFELESTAREHLTDYEIALADLESLVGADLQLFPSSKATTNRRAK